MFVIYQVELKITEKDTYKRVQEFPTLEDAEIFLRDHANDGNFYTVVME